jgi:NitT/TauT family transport system substrate-binding protein
LFVALREPNASDIEKNGYGYVVASIGEIGGIVPYTAYSAKDSYIKNNRETIANFTMAIQKGLDFVHSHSDKEIAEIIIKQFPDTSLIDLENAIKRYREIDAWPTTTDFSKESFDHLQDIMLDYGAIDKKVAYEQLIYNE